MRVGFGPRLSLLGLVASLLWNGGGIAQAQICDPTGILLPAPGYRIQPEETEWRESLALSLGELVIEASLKWAASHDGQFPQDVQELQKAWGGENGTLRWPNTFDGARTVPSDGVAGYTGAVGYSGLVRGNQWVGMNLQVFGQNQCILSTASTIALDPLTYTRPRVTLQDRLDGVEIR